MHRVSAAAKFTVSKPGYKEISGVLGYHPFHSLHQVFSLGPAKENDEFSWQLHGMHACMYVCVYVYVCMLQMRMINLPGSSTVCMYVCKLHSMYVCS